MSHVITDREGQFKHFDQATFAQVDDDIAAPMAYIPGRRWWIALACSGSLMLLGFSLMAYTVSKGVGVWGNNSPVFWAFPIVNFVFWIGIGHAGTLISAILFLFRQPWRNAIARFAEAMTIFAVMTAAMFPVIHMGRPWLAHWVFPYPNDMSIWVNFRSPLVWDVFAISTYFTVSLLFWYVGLIPDLAAMRERAATKVHRVVYSVLSWGWTGLNRHWRHYERTYLILAGLSTPLVVSVHTIVSFDFATSVIPGWHTTILPPYFVAGAVFSGFAMVLSVLIVVRRIFHLEHIVTMRHLDHMNKVVLATGLMVGYAYCIEIFTAWYSQEDAEIFMILNRITGPYWWAFALMFSCNVLAPQVHWSAACTPLDPDHVHRFDPREYRYVVRTVCHHRHFTSSRLSAGQLGHVQTNAGRLGNPRREFRALFHARSAFCPLPPGYFNDRDQGRPAGRADQQAGSDAGPTPGGRGGKCLIHEFPRITPISTN